MRRSSFNGIRNGELYSGANVVNSVEITIKGTLKSGKEAMDFTEVTLGEIGIDGSYGDVNITLDTAPVAKGAKTFTVVFKFEVIGVTGDGKVALEVKPKAGA